MAKVQESYKIGPDGKAWERKVTHLTLSVYPNDIELLDFCQHRLGCSQSEVLRTAIRSLAMQLAQVPTS